MAAQISTGDSSKMEKPLNAASSPTADVESAAVQSRELRRKKRLKLAAFIVLLIVFHAALITALDLTLLKIRRPTYRLSAIRVENIIADSSADSPSFLIDLDAEITFRNRNFGSYTFEFGYLTFSYAGAHVGDAVVERSRVKMYSSRSMNVKVNVSSESVREKSILRRDMAGGGGVVLRVDSELRGQVRLMKVLPKDRVVKLSCSFRVHLEKKSVEELSCD